MTVHTLGVARPLRPEPARLMRLASFANEQRLPLGDTAVFHSGDVLIDLSHTPHAAAEISRWALALDAPVITEDPEVIDYRLHVVHTVRGLLPDMAFVKVVARVMVTETRS